MARHTLLFASLLVLAASPPVAARHGGVQLDARHATPGIRLELIEQPVGAAAKTSRYHLRVAGFTGDLLFGIWIKEFGASFQPVRSRVRVDERGMVVADDEATWQPVVVEPGPYPAGAAWEVGLVSADGTVTSFARVIPRPIAARNGPCTVSLELASRRGDKFLVSGVGFLPMEQVAVESSNGGRIVPRRQRVRSDGQLPPDVVVHLPGGADHRAHYTVKGSRCEVSLDYEWGDRALVRR